MYLRVKKMKSSKNCKKFKKIYVPKFFKLDHVSVLSGNPVGYTTIKLHLRKGKVKIPFPKIIKVKGTGWYSNGGGNDKKGEYIIIANNK